MNILLIHQAFASPDEPGGTRHYELGRECVRHGHAFTIVASRLNYVTGQPIESREQHYAGVRVVRAYTAPTLHRSFVWRVISFLSFMLASVVAALRIREFDIVIGTTPPIFQAVSAWLVAVIRRRPFLLEVRDLWPEFAIDMGVLKNPILIKLSRWLERFLYARATHIVVNSPAYRAYLIERGLAPAKITLIANGVDVDMFDPVATGRDWRQVHGLDSKFVVTYAGALGLANDIPVILRAAARLRDYPAIQFVLIGSGKERAHLEEQAQQLDLSNVLFAGSQPKARMPEVLAASDACLATLQNIKMFRTTYPNKVFDYMAAGRPTVLAIDGVIRDVIEAADGGIFVPPGDDAALAAAVLQLCNQPETARQLGQAARAYVVNHFDRRHQAEDFINLLQRVARQ